MEETNSMEKEIILKKGREIVLSAPQLYIDIDIEADGIAGYGSMLSLGAKSPTGEFFYQEIKPMSKRFLEGHKYFCEQHGLNRERLLKDAPTYLVVMKQFNDWLENLSKDYEKDPVFTAFNAAFDWAFVDLYFLKCKINNPFGIAPFDLKSLALSLSDWNWRRTSKSKLPSIIIPDGDFTHHALEDAQYQQKLHFGMAGLLGPKGYLDIASRLI